MSIELRGALPHPQLLRQYNEVVHDGAERIVKLAEDQVRHRQSMEARGQIFAFVLALPALAGGFVLTALGESAKGLASLVLAIVALGGLFVYREMRSQKTERPLKRD